MSKSKQFFIFAFIRLIFLLFISTYLNAEFNTIKNVNIKLLKIEKLNNKTYKLNILISLPPKIHIIDNKFFKIIIKKSDGVIKNFKVLKGEKQWKGEKIFANKIEIETLIKLRHQQKNITLTISYQSCTEEDPPTCYFTTKKTLTVNLNELIPKLNENENINTKILIYLKKNLLLAFFLIFLGGILTSLTPCVYPIIPITVGYIGAKSEGKKIKGFILSSLFVLGLSLVYATLGIVAASTGTIFGSITNSPIVLIFISLIFITMGFSMFGVFNIQLPPALAGKLHSKKKKGYIGALLVGMTSGLIVGPCVGPVLIALLTWIANTKNLLLGFTILFTFAWGMGLLFILIGTFSSIITALPKSGKWMDIVKYFFGFLLFGVGVYYLKFLIGEKYIFIPITMIFILTAVVIKKYNKKISALLIILALLVLIWGIFSLNKNLPYKTFYTTNISKAFEIAKKNKKLVIIDFYADWCLECKELDKKVFNTPEVKKILKNNVFVRINLTKQNNFIKKVIQQYNIKGLPTILIYNYKKEELKRLHGFINKNDFLFIINKYNK